MDKQIARMVRALDPSGGDVSTGGCDALYVGTAGNLSFIDAMGSTVTAMPVPQGMLPVAAQQILNSGTTATDLYALFW